MGNTIQKCKLFLALGEEQELQDGYGKIGAYIQRLNRTYRANELQLQLIPYGAKDGSFLSGGAAVDVHKEVQDCEIALFLFYRDVPEALKEELQEVYALFQKTKKPKILTFFRLEEGAAAVGVGDRLEKLLDYIGSDIRHYYNVYSHIDSVTLALVTHMAELRWVDAPRMVNGKIRLPGGVEIDSEDLAQFRNSRKLKQLREEWRACSARLGSIDAAPEMREREQELLRQISDLETATLETTTRMYREMVAGNEMSEHYEAAYRAFARGDYAHALEILDIQRILDESVALEDAEDVIKSKLQQCVDELVLAVHCLRAQEKGEESRKEILATYEKIYQLIKDSRLNLAPLDEYVRYLYGENEYVRAKKVGNTLRGEYCKDDIEISEEDKAKLLLLLGNINSKIADEKARKQAERDYQDALEIWKELAVQNPSVYEPYLAGSYNNLGAFYGDVVDRREEAERYLTKALEIYTRLAKSQPAVQLDQANSYDNLGAFYSCALGRRQEAEKCYQESQKIYERLAQAQPAVYESDLAMVYNNLGNLYSDDGRRQEAEDHYQKSRELYERLAKEQPSVYEPDLAKIYNNLGVFYSDDGRRQEAEDHYQKIAGALRAFGKSAAGGLRAGSGDDL